MIGWIALVGAIASEVTATLSLRASVGARSRRWIPVVVVGYIAAFSCLGLVLGSGVPVGIAYAIWAAVGVVLTAILGRVIFKDRLSKVTAGGLAVVSIGIALIELGATHG